MRDGEGVRTAPGVANNTGFRIHTLQGPGGFPVTVFAPEPQAASRSPSTAEAVGFLTTFSKILERFRPNVVLTYGADAASAGVAGIAHRAGAKVAFWLHNLNYTDPAAFTECDVVVVPSSFSRDHYRATLGLDCVALPPVIDPTRVLVDRPDCGKFVTFVNPSPEKGVFFFARLVEVFGRNRPEIPFLVVEGRGRTEWLARCGVELSGVASLHRLRKTADPRQFYGVTRVLVVPSVCRESFGRVVAEAMLNSIPVVASDRGSLPDVVGTGGVCLPLPQELTSDSRSPPSVADVGPWAHAILRLWDDPGGYEAAAISARAAANRFASAAVVPEWEAFLTTLAARS